MPLGFRPNDNLDVTVQESHEAQQPLGGEPAQLVVLELGDVWLRNAKQLCRARLSQAAGGGQLVHLHRELHAQLPLLGVREAKIYQHITASRVDRLNLLSSHSAPRSLLVPFSA